MKEYEKIDKFMLLCEKFKASKIEKNVKQFERSVKDSNSYNHHNLLLYCFTKFNVNLLVIVKN